MRGAQDDHELGPRGCGGKPGVGPGIGGSAAPWIDMRGDQAERTIGGGIGTDGHFRKIFSHLDAQLLRIVPIADPRVSRRTLDARRELLAHRADPPLIGRRFQETSPVQRRHQLGELLRRHALTELAREGGLQIDLAPGPVEQRDQVVGPDSEHDRLRRRAARVAQTDHPLAVVLDRESLQRPDARFFDHRHAIELCQSSLR